MESKQQTTRPFCTSTCAGGWAKRHSSSERVQRRRTCSRQTSSVSQRESLPPPPEPPVVVTSGDGIDDRVTLDAVAALHDDDDDDGGPLTADIIGSEAAIAPGPVGGSGRETYAATLLAMTVSYQPHDSLNSLSLLLPLTQERSSSCHVDKLRTTVTDRRRRATKYITRICHRCRRCVRAAPLKSRTVFRTLHATGCWLSGCLGHRLYVEWPLTD